MLKYSQRHCKLHPSPKIEIHTLCSIALICLVFCQQFKCHALGLKYVLISVCKADMHATTRDYCSIQITATNQVVRRGAIKVASFNYIINTEFSYSVIKRHCIPTKNNIPKVELLNVVERFPEKLKLCQS